MTWREHCVIGHRAQMCILWLLQKTWHLECQVVFETCLKASAASCRKPTLILMGLPITSFLDCSPLQSGLQRRLVFLWLTHWSQNPECAGSVRAWVGCLFTPEPSRTNDCG